MAAYNSRKNDERGKEITRGEEKSPYITAEGATPSAAAGVTSQEAVRGARRLSTIPEQELERGSHHAQGGSKHNQSSYSLGSMDQYSAGSSSTDTLSPAHQPDAGDTCAVILLNCLFCRFLDIFLMLPDTCENAVGYCCPAYKHFSATAEPVQSNDCNCNVEFDCGLFDACHETGECLELAMEMSEVCYR